jgi:hypothetical protein
MALALLQQRALLGARARTGVVCAATQSASRPTSSHCRILRYPDGTSRTICYPVLTEEEPAAWVGPQHASTAAATPSPPAASDTLVSNTALEDDVGEVRETPGVCLLPTRTRAFPHLCFPAFSPAAAVQLGGAAHAGGARGSARQGFVPGAATLLRWFEMQLASAVSRECSLTQCSRCAAVIAGSR